MCSTTTPVSTDWSTISSSRSISHSGRTAWSRKGVVCLLSGYRWLNDWSSCFCFLLQCLCASYSSSRLVPPMPIDLYCHRMDLRVCLLDASHRGTLFAKMWWASTLAQTSARTNQFHRWVLRWAWSMRKGFSLTIEPCAMGCDGQAKDFVGESFFSFFTTFFSVGTPVAVVFNVFVLVLFPTIKHHYRHQIRWLLQVMFTSAIISSISNQIVSAFATRSLSMFFNLRFLSILGIQWLGFGLCLISSFICGVQHAIHYAKSNKGRLEWKMV